jgi:hypothetical protein
MTILSIHDSRPDGTLAFDLTDLLSVLGSSTKGYSWIVSRLECTGDDVIQEMCNIVAEGAKGGVHGLLLSNSDLADVAFKNIHRTINTELMGQPRGTFTPELSRKVWDTGAPACPPGTIAIRCVDRRYFEVQTSTPEQADLIRRSFSDVRVNAG